MRLNPINLEACDWAAIGRRFPLQFTHTDAWLSFAREVSGGEAIVAEVHDRSEVCGYFFGVLFKRMGIKILGSPFPGWTLPYLGFALGDPADTPAALEALERFAFATLGCMHYELTDRTIAPDLAVRLGKAFDTVQGFVSDLTVSEGQLFARMSSACRRAIRKSEKAGVTVEHANPAGFAAEYMVHLTDVFAKQGLTPTYGVDRVETLIRCLYPTGQLLLLRARGPDGRSIATGIYPGGKGYSFFWGNGSLRSDQQFRPNEALHWHAMCTWKARGSKVHDWGGAGEYKRKYGGQEFRVAGIRVSRFAAISFARKIARGAYDSLRKAKRRSRQMLNTD